MTCKHSDSEKLAAYASLAVNVREIDGGYEIVLRYGEETFWKWDGESLFRGLALLTIAIQRITMEACEIEERRLLSRVASALAEKGEA